MFWPAAVSVEDELVEALGRRGLVSERPSSVVGRNAGVRRSSMRSPATSRTSRCRDRSGASCTGGSATGSRRARRSRRRDGGARRLPLRRGARVRGRWITALATRAFELLLEAGESAIARAAVPSAIGLFERALSIAADARSRCLALVALARSDLATLAFDRANARLLEAAVSHGRPMIRCSSRTCSAG